MSEAVRDRIILLIPYLVGGLIGFGAISFIPMRPDSWPIYFSAGVLPALVGSSLTWLTPLRNIQLRHLKRTYPKAFLKQKPRI